MKCYKVKYLVKDELRRELIIYAYSLKQAKILAEANPVDGVTTINVRESKSKNAIEMMRNYVIRYGGEAILLDKEIDNINKMRIKCGKEPIDNARTKMLY